MRNPTISIAPAVWPGDRPAVEGLFRAYAASLDVDLSFQNFEGELAGLPGAYATPDGAVFLARVDGTVAGVGCFRAHGAGCEMKRLYVQPDFRGHSLGRKLALALIAEAKARGRLFMALDSLATMTEAQALYRSLGFREVPAYYDNPLPGTVYMQLDLSIS